jgi:hypothetical protein
VWKKVIEKGDIQKYEEKYKIISSRMYLGKTMIHVWSDSAPSDGFVPITPDLEDAYFYYIHGLNGESKE